MVHSNHQGLLLIRHRESRVFLPPGSEQTTSTGDFDEELQEKNAVIEALQTEVAILKSEAEMAH